MSQRDQRIIWHRRCQRILFSGRKVKHTRRFQALPTEQFSAKLPKCKQIDQHLQTGTIEDVGIIKVFSAGFIVHNPDIGPFIVFIQVYTIYKPGYSARSFSTANLDRWQKSLG